ncbi:hypothetical protein [Streptomyces sp. Tue6028]|uniref:hypothetical protein n=1 Tax=Streptomyces sp. Tue6028 TaxID=2036037 RepID=UPI003D762D96
MRARQDPDNRATADPSPEATGVEPDDKEHSSTAASSPPARTKRTRRPGDFPNLPDNIAHSAADPVAKALNQLARLQTSPWEKAVRQLGELESHSLIRTFQQRQPDPAEMLVQKIATFQADPVAKALNQLARLQMSPWEEAVRQLGELESHSLIRTFRQRQPDPAEMLVQKIATLQADPVAGTFRQLEALQAAPFDRMVRQLGALQSDLVVRTFRSLQTDPFSKLVQRLDVLQDPFAATLHSIAGRASEVFPRALLEKITGERTLWLPENLRHLRPALWEWLFRISVKDGACLIWAPRRDIVDDLLTRKTTQERHQLLLDRRDDVVTDVLHSLSEVEHPELKTYVSFAREAAVCIQQGQDAAAQALLGNILDSALRAHGRAWFEAQFGGLNTAEDTHHKMVRGVLARHRGGVIVGRSTMVGPYLLVTSLKNVFDGPPAQSTFNRHLTVHHVREDTYRQQFALTTLLTVQGLLRQFDGYLCSDPDPRDDNEDTEADWTALMNQAIAVLSTLNYTVSQDAFAALAAADPEAYIAKRDQVMKAFNGLRKSLPAVYGPAPVCDSCTALSVPGPAEARCGKPGTFWWCQTCATKLGARKPL